VTRPKKIPAYYWDSNLFIAYLNGDDEDQLRVVSDLLALAERNEISLYSSAITALEVAYSAAEFKANSLATETSATIDAFWKGGIITTVEIDVMTALYGRDLMRQGLEKGDEAWKIKPRDALHLASAARLPVKEMHTWDGRLYKWSEMVGVTVCAPYLTQPPLPLDQ
jgi:predicted nucleic acid-binding protein